MAFITVGSAAILASPDLTRKPTNVASSFLSGRRISYSLGKTVQAITAASSNPWTRRAPTVFSRVKENQHSEHGDAGSVVLPGSDGTIDDLQHLLQSFGRKSFPKGFVFGASTAAYQIEGALEAGGRGKSNWDKFIEDFPDKIRGRATGERACDSFHLYERDVQMLKELGVDAYRFSISWPRILPNGTVKGGVSKEGIRYYNNLIDTCIKNGIKPYATIFHWDVPQTLEDAYSGFLDANGSNIVHDFKEYARICYQEFGDRVTHWTTINEPGIFSGFGYGLGTKAPGRCSKFLGCPAGDSLTEPYIVSHNLLKAHAAAARLYMDEFQSKQMGEVGITLAAMWYNPIDNNYETIQAGHRQLDFELGWFMDPLVHGDYPFNMKALLRDRLPVFTDEEKEQLKGSYNFIGLNYYTGNFASAVPYTPKNAPTVSLADAYCNPLESYNGVDIGEKTETWIYIYPDGLKELLLTLKKKYNDPAIYITENGMAEKDKGLPLQQALKDTQRQKYLIGHLSKVHEAIKEGVNVKGYFAWSLLDNFEWQDGYENRFGLYYVDFNDLARHPKDSAKLYAKFLKN